MNEMKRLLKITLKNDVFRNESLPGPSNKKFYPRKSTIRNHMMHACRKVCHSLIDRECLQNKIEQWKKENPTTNIYFRPKGIVKETTNERNDEDVCDEIDGVNLKSGSKTSLLFVY